MSLDLATVKSIARLARIRLEEDECPALVGELSSILGWVEQLSAVDTEGVDPMTSVADLTLPQRDDMVTDGAGQAAILANAPASFAECFTVPKVVE